MRVLTLALFFVLHLSCYCQVSWERLSPIPTGNAGRDIVFLDDQKGFIVNSEEILITRDGGTTWDILRSISSGNNIRFFNSIGIIVGNNGSIYKSIDNGDSWNNLNTPFNANLNAISIINEDTLRITGDKILLLSDDGGTSWTSLPIPDVNVEDSYFTSSLIGHVACTNGTILKTIDGGNSWYKTETSNIIPSNFFRIVFINENIGFASQEHNDIYKTVDGGETWEETTSPTDAAYSIQFLDEKVGFIAGEHGAMHKTKDGGNTWDWMGFDGRKYGNDLYSIFFLNENEGYATGLRGRIIKTSNGGVSWEEYSNIYGTIDRLQFTSDEIGYLKTGNDYYKTNNGGKKWEYLSTPNHYEFARDFQFVNTSVGYSIGGGTTSVSGSVLKTTDGGSHWEPLDILIDEGLNSIYFLNENIGFVSGGFNRKTTLKTNDGGNTWKQVIDQTFGNIQFVDSMTGYANRTGYYGGRIYKSVDGGETWNINFEVDEEIRYIDFVNDSVGYLVGDNSLIYKTIDSGYNWKELEAPYGYFVQALFYSNYLGYILDDAGQLYRTFDGGENWESIYQMRGINSLEVRNLELFISGENGSILKSAIDPSELIEFEELSLLSISDSTATINGLVKSSLGIKNINIELGTQSGIYDYTYELGTFREYSNTVNYTFKNLVPLTKYFCRLMVSDGDFYKTSEEFSFTTELDLITGIEKNEIVDFSIYPNPAINTLKIAKSGIPLVGSYIISTLDGKIMVESKMTASGEIDISFLNRGIYLIRLITVEGTFAKTSKFIKE